MPKTFDLATTFVHLDDGGGAEPIEVTRSFWADGAAARYSRLVGAVDFRTSGDLHSFNQEIHPEADEVIFLVSGAIDVVLEEGGEERTVAVEAGHAAIVPSGVWHRLVMREPGRLVFINNRKAMQSRRLR